MIRPARPDDTGALVGLVRDLASYERAADQVALDDEALSAALFGGHPKVFAHVAERNGEIVGMAIWFLTYSTWTGRHGVHIEDLFVRPDARGLGLGRALICELSRLAVDAGYTRVEWSVLDWNEPAIGFYRRLGAEALEEWTGYRLSGAALSRLAQLGATAT